MHKQLMDASGPALVIAYFINNVIPVVQPILIFVGVIASLTWYGVRFYDRFKYGPNFDEKD